MLSNDKLYSMKDTLQRIKRKAIDWSKIFAEYISPWTSVLRIYKEISLKLNNTKSNNLFEKWAKT